MVGISNRHDGRGDPDAGTVAHVRRINLMMAEGFAEMEGRTLVLTADQAAALKLEMFFPNLSPSPAWKTYMGMKIEVAA